MSQSLWIAKTGLDAQQTKMATISNNLANVSTNGFKRGVLFLRTCYIRMFVKLVRNRHRTQCCPLVCRSVLGPEL